MFENYFKVAVRTVSRQRGYAFINIAGLAIGMASFIIIMLWVDNELSYDRFHEHHERIYRVLLYYPETDGYSWSGPGPLASYLKSEYPEIINAATIFSDVNRPLKHGDIQFAATLCGVEPSFFEFFSFKFINGDYHSAVAIPNYIVLTARTSQKYFGMKDPRGEIMSLDWWGRWLNFEVTGVIEDVPENSHLQFDFILPIDFVTASGMDIDQWSTRAYKTYVLIDKNAPANKINKKIEGVLHAHQPESKALLYLQPLTSIHLKNPGGGGPITYIYIFSAIAALIIFIAGSNYMNLAAARSATRIKEMSMRKVVGASRAQLIKQNLVEALLYALLSLVLAFVLVILILPSINALVGVELQLRPTTQLVMLLIAATLFTAVLSGSYPAFVLSNYQSARALTGRMPHHTKGPLFRKLLVTTQFSISILLIICTLEIADQLHYMREKDLGFNKEHVINLEFGGGLYEQFHALRADLEGNPEIVSVTRTNFSFNKRFGSSGISWEGKMDEEQSWAAIHSVDYNFLDTFGMKMVQGRFFSKEFPSDAAEGIILNQTAVRRFNIPDPIGKRFRCPLPLDQVKDGTIIGVIEDYYFSSLHYAVEPLILAIVPYWYSDVYIRISSQDISTTISYVEKRIKELAPDYLFNYRFLDEEIAHLYNTDQQVGKLVQYGTFLALFISCLGLFGLASFTVEQRKKEMGIRKVLGASVMSIALLIIRQFNKWVLVANVIAWPIAYYLMDKWLTGFAYRVNLALWTFVCASLLTIAIAVITVSYQSIRAALSNPIDALKYE